MVSADRRRFLVDTVDIEASREIVVILNCAHRPSKADRLDILPPEFRVSESRRSSAIRSAAASARPPPALRKKCIFRRWCEPSCETRPRRPANLRSPDLRASYGWQAKRASSSIGEGWLTDTMRSAVAATVRRSAKVVAAKVDESHPLRHSPVSFPRMSKSNGLLYVGQRLPLSKVQFDSTVSSNLRCSTGSCDL